MDLKLAEVEPRERYKLLIGLVIPRPIAWISTRSANGVANCAPFSFFNVFAEEPPLCVVGMNPRQTDGGKKHTLKNIERTKEFVHAGLTSAPSRLVQHPRIAEAAASLECRLYRLIEVNAARWLVIGEIVL